MTLLIILLAIPALALIWFRIPFSPVKRDFKGLVDKTRTSLEPVSDEDVFRTEDFSSLPEPLRKYFERSGFVGKRKMKVLHMEYKDVDFRQKREGQPLSIDYSQFSFRGIPQRIALIDTSMMGIPFEGLDSYVEGHGEMKGVVAKAITIFDVKGESMDQGCLVTYLAECFLIPSCLEDGHIRFEAIDDYHVRGIIEYNGQKGQGIFTFNENYEMVSFRTEERGMAGPDGSISMVPWTAYCSDYSTGSDGLRLPGTFKAVWNLPEGDFTYFDGRIQSIAFE